mmetsp:Transcript_15364/g.35068  ORF Transcript_15364/g.35068 Transcript_15364/m.35068 type:complete len:209 (+) Transcript_15364:348-974(+)
MCRAVCTCPKRFPSASQLHSWLPPMHPASRGPMPMPLPSLHSPGSSRTSASAVGPCPLRHMQGPEAWHFQLHHFGSLPAPNPGPPQQIAPQVTVSLPALAIHSSAQKAKPTLGAQLIVTPAPSGWMLPKHVAHAATWFPLGSKLLPPPGTAALNATSFLGACFAAPISLPCVPLTRETWEGAGECSTGSQHQEAMYLQSELPLHIPTQ